MSEPKHKIAFEVTVDGKPVKLAVVKPSLAVQQKAQMHRARVFAEFVKAGALLEASLDTHMRDQKLWDDAKTAELAALTDRLLKNTEVVEGRVRGTTFEQARQAAVQMRRDRIALQALFKVRSDLKASTAEGQADQAHFNYLVAACTVHEDTRKPYYRDVEDYLSRENDPAAYAAAERFATFYNGYDPDAERNLPENQFLLKYKLCNDKLHLTRTVNGAERLCDADGRLVDEDGNLVNEAGERVDAAGNRVGQDGRPVERETFPFLDEAGNPVPDPAVSSAST